MDLPQVQIILFCNFSNKWRRSQLFVALLLINYIVGSVSGNCWRFAWYRGRSMLGGVRRGLQYTLCIDQCNYSINLNHGARFCPDFLQDAFCRRGYFCVYFVSRDFKERLIPFNLVSFFFKPLSDSTFKNRLAHLRHHYIR